MHKFLLAVVAVGLLAAGGCSGANSETDSPAKVVGEFLEAVRIGNSEVASAKLTPLALQRIQENDMDFAPPASETAQFNVGQVEMFEDNKAFVESTWIERDVDGQTFEEKMTWGLKLNNGEWRISGMAAHMGPGQPPVVVDFENPGQLMGLQEPSTPAAAGENVPRQANQAVQDPFNQPVAR